MGLAYNTYLNSSKVYGCKTCKAHLSNHEDIISRVRFVRWPPFVRREIKSNGNGKGNGKGQPLALALLCNGPPLQLTTLAP